MIAAGGALGLPRRDDLNRQDTLGIGYLNCNIKHGVRQSSAAAFLQPIRRRSNLVVMTDTCVDKLLFDGKRAFGVLTRREGAVREYRAREIILSAGALQSPKILQLSGIGPEPLLRQHGIKGVVDSRGCGMNLRDHRLLFIQHRHGAAHAPPAGAGAAETPAGGGNHARRGIDGVRVVDISILPVRAVPT